MVWPCLAPKVLLEPSEDYKQNPWSDTDLERLKTITKGASSRAIDWVKVAQSFPGVEPIRVRLAFKMCSSIAPRKKFPALSESDIRILVDEAPPPGRHPNSKSYDGSKWEELATKITGNRSVTELRKCWGKSTRNPHRKQSTSSQNEATSDNTARPVGTPSATPEPRSVSLTFQMVIGNMKNPLRPHNSFAYSKSVFPATEYTPSPKPTIVTPFSPKLSTSRSLPGSTPALRQLADTSSNLSSHRPQPTQSDDPAPATDVNLDVEKPQLEEAAFPEILSGDDDTTRGVLMVWGLRWQR
ncbi:hypothetical protein P7C70_g4987, partial [Phenoliferia sp. Uapishka_3]